ncbi:DUF4276 family protein [Sphaerisporangium sp. NPDC088356]|uniref:DUF4276 family protein n=1 Tax=Sphaerisporangium sp. NPDC088356 TaxID=3154871 RepID=UPI0034386C70
MTRIRIGTIVEGHGEVQALPVLLRRLAMEIAPHLWADIPPPRRVNRNSLVAAGGIEGAVHRLVSDIEGATGVLVLLDSDDDCPADLGPRLLSRARAARADVPMVVVLANREFEAWFLAAAISLRGHASLRADLKSPDDPERLRGCKEWLTNNRTGAQPYNPKKHQTSLAARFDLHLARQNSPSFDKFWRDVVYLITGKR